MIGAGIIIICLLILMDYSNLSWSKNKGTYFGIISMICLIVSMIISIRHENKKQTKNSKMIVAEKVKALRSLPIEEFEKRFSDMYDSANDEEKEEIIRLFKEGVDEFIKKVDSFIEDTTKMLELDNALKPQLV